MREIVLCPSILTIDGCADSIALTTAERRRLDPKQIEGSEMMVASTANANIGRVVFFGKFIKADARSIDMNRGRSDVGGGEYAGFHGPAAEHNWYRSLDRNRYTCNRTAVRACLISTDAAPRKPGLPFPTRKRNAGTGRRDRSDAIYLRNR